MTLAHGLGGRTDLPIPTWMALWGGTTALLVSFAALVALWPRPRWEGRALGRVVLEAPGLVPRVLILAARVLGLAAFLLVVVAAVVGDNDQTNNIAPTAVYITFWVGMTLLCGLVGDAWALVNPFDTLAAALGRAGPSRRGESREAASLPYWPAVVGLLAFLWLELVYPDRDQPRVLAVALLGYTAVVLGAVAVRGRGWLPRGEAFTATFGVLAHGAPLGRSDDGRLRLRPPFAGLAGLEPAPGLAALVLVVLGSTSFDGLTRTRFWTDLSDGFSGAGYTLLGTVGLLWAIGLAWGVYQGAMVVMSRVTGGDRAPVELALAFAHSLVPIALAYSVAHYFSFFLYEGQAVIAHASDPFGFGWDLFGTARRQVDYGLLSPGTVAYIQAGAIVLGHVAGVVVAHDRALALFGKAEATRSQYPLVGAMVVFTVGGLLLLLGG